MKTATDIKRALARESLVAMVAMRTTGQGPTVESSPTLMAVWQAARDGLVHGGVDKSPATFQYEGLKCLYGALWNGRGQLERFYLHDRVKGVLLLTGDMNGPVFRAPKAQAQAASMPSPPITDSKVHP